MINKKDSDFKDWSSQIKVTDVSALMFRNDVLQTPQLDHKMVSIYIYRIDNFKQRFYAWVFRHDKNV